MRFGRTVLAAIGLAVAAGGLTVLAQKGKDAKRDGTTTLQVYSRLTVVDVVATDAQGQPVHGLQQSDFTMLEDGKPQPIRNFEEISTQFAEPPRQMPPNVYSNVPTPAPSNAVNILLLDFAHEAPQDSTDPKQLSRATYLQSQVKQAAMAALDKMQAGTRVAVISMTNNLHILQDFTSDPALLKAAINAAPYDLDGNAITGIAQPHNKHDTSPFDDHATSGDQGVQEDMRNRMVLEAFDEIAADVTPMKGRKNLIWFSTGIPDVTDPNHKASIPDYSKPLSLAYDVLTQAQVSVYPIYAGGVGILSERQLSLQMVADATGGVAYIGTNDMATSVVKALDNGANYYSIAYEPPSQKLDGAYHKIEVTVNRPGVTLIFRKGYYADDLSKVKLPIGLTLGGTPPAAKGGNMKAPMSRGLATSSDLLFEVGVEPSTLAPKPGDPPVLGTLDEKLKNKKLTRYGFQYVVPAEQIKFTDGPKGTHLGKVEYDIAVYDSNEKLLTGLSQTVKMPLSDDVYKQMEKNHTPMRFFQQIDLPPGQLFIRVGVLDPTTNKTGTLELPLAVGRAAQRQAPPPVNPGE